MGTITAHRAFPRGGTPETQLRQSLNSRPIRTFLAALILVAITGCGAAPLESVGERSDGWIGSLTGGVTFLPSERIPVTVMASP